MTSLKTIVNNATKKVNTLRSILEAVDSKYSNIVWNVGVKDGNTLLEGTFFNHGETGEIEVNIWASENGSIIIEVGLYDNECEAHGAIFHNEWEAIAFIQEVNGAITGGVRKD